MSSLLVTFAAALCMAVAVGAHRSCGLGKGVVCMPTVCSRSQCLLFKNATCVDDKCGCEGRFFTYIEKEKTYQDVTKMCTSGNVVLNFANFTDSALRQNDESAPQPRPFVRFFYHFNNLVTEILADLVAHLRMAAEKHPVQANIDLAKKASTTLDNLKNMTEEHRTLWKLIKHIKDSAAIHDEDEDSDAKIDEAIKKVFKTHPNLAPHAKWALKDIKDEDEDTKKFTAAHKAKVTEALNRVFKQHPELMAQAQTAMKGVRDEDEDTPKTKGKKFTAAHKAKVTEALNRVFKQHPELMAQAQAAMKGVRDEDEDGFKRFKIGVAIPTPRWASSVDRTDFGGHDEDINDATDDSLELVKAHADVLQDMLNDEDYMPVGASGKPGVLSDRAFFSSLIQTVLPVVQNLLGF